MNQTKFSREIKTITIFFSVLSILLQAGGQNPFTPAVIYLADPSARVWSDGKLYVYGSLDESCDYYCSGYNPVMYTQDLVTWELARDAFMSMGEGDGVPYNDKILYAPDAAYRDGIYYLYYCQPDKTQAEGVAWSQYPSGPFGEGKAINLAGYNEIDPAVFIDDDGQAYYLWGQFTLKMAKLKDNMKEIDLATLNDSVITEGEHYFHEGAFLAKRNDIYYLVYADISRGDIPTCIGYATSSSPFGPYEYRGVIIDNNHCNPGNWNNHGSIAEYKGQWYVFYHRSTHGCKTMRKACVEPISFLPDGLIPEVEMTSQGAGEPLDANSAIQSEWACILNGNVRIKQFEDTKEELTEIFNGDKAAFKYVNFGEGADTIILRIAPGEKGGKLVVSLDKPWHGRLALLEITAGDGQWKEMTFPMEKASGVHAVWLHFYGEGNKMFSIDWFRFK